MYVINYRTRLAQLYSGGGNTSTWTDVKRRWMRIAERVRYIGNSDCYANASTAASHSKLQRSVERCGEHRTSVETQHRHFTGKWRLGAWANRLKVHRSSQICLILI